MRAATLTRSDLRPPTPGPSGPETLPILYTSVQLKSIGPIEVATSRALENGPSFRPKTRKSGGSGRKLPHQGGAAGSLSPNRHSTTELSMNEAQQRTGQKGSPPPGPPMRCNSCANTNQLYTSGRLFFKCLGAGAPLRPLRHCVSFLGIITRGREARRDGPYFWQVIGCYGRFTRAAVGLARDAAGILAKWDPASKWFFAGGGNGLTLKKGVWLFDSPT